jgi:nucleoside-diphosphate-sugar epimerase
MNILVTGGSGFIGTYLVELLLKNGHSVKIFDKNPSKLYPDLVIQGDVRDTQLLSNTCKGIDIIYNLAAEHADNVTPSNLYDEVNVGGAINVVTAAKKHNIKKIIFISSVAIYGLNKRESDETCIPDPFNAYGHSKLNAEKVLIKWAEEDKKNSLVILRPSVIFGEGNRGNVYNLISQINNGKFIMVGKGNNKKSMGYVANISQFLIQQLSAKTGVNIYNFADKPDLTSKEIIDIIYNELGKVNKFPSIPYFIGLMGGYFFDLLSKITGKTFPISSIRIIKFTSETSINTDKLEATGFKSPYTLEEGLRRMIQYEFLNKNIKN